jgi:hypothetical protein
MCAGGWMLSGGGYPEKFLQKKFQKGLAMPVANAQNSDADNQTEGS